jgi:hypothetical protein
MTSNLPSDPSFTPVSIPPLLPHSPTPHHIYPISLHLVSVSQYWTSTTPPPSAKHYRTILAHTLVLWPMEQSFLCGPVTCGRGRFGQFLITTNLWFGSDLGHLSAMVTDHSALILMLILRFPIYHMDGSFHSSGLAEDLQLKRSPCNCIRGSEGVREGV